MEDLSRDSHLCSVVINESFYPQSLRATDLSRNSGFAWSRRQGGGSREERPPNDVFSC